MIEIAISQWTNVDKSGWGPGPWQDEPDKIHWIDKATDLDCLVVRGPLGALCGYVAVTEGHPAFEQDYESVHDMAPKDADGWSSLDVHGGLTFAGFCMEGEEPGTGVCHVPQPGRPARVWWLGFDCAHYRDIAPASAARDRERGWDPLEPNARYRDIAYVRAEVTSLAAQLKAMAT